MALLNQLTKGYQIILGSSSPRRVELLSGLDLLFRVEPIGGVDESSITPPDNLEQLPLLLSQIKSKGYPTPLSSKEILITADTVVICQGEAMGKPKDREEGVEMLKKLSGKSHKVITGVTIRGEIEEISFSSLTVVTFRELRVKEIEYYIDNYAPFDKAGSYGVQEWIGYCAISKIEGSYYNVMGLPVEALYSSLLKFLQKCE